MTDSLFEEPDQTEADPIQKRLDDKDAFIAQLQREQAELRADLRARQTLEELADKVSTRPSQPNRQDTSPDPDNADNKPNLTEEVKKILQQELARSSAQSNVEKAKIALREKFGNDYNNALKMTAENLGVSEKFLNDMAVTSPDGLVRLVESIQPKSQDDYRPVAAPRSTINSNSSTFNAPVLKNKNYYDALRKSDLGAYFSPKVQNEMVKEAERQGPAFFNP